MARREDEGRIPEEREKVVVERDRSGPGAVIITVVALIILGLIIWLVFGLANTANDATNDGIDVEVQPDTSQPAPQEADPAPQQDTEPAPGTDTEN